MGMRVNVLFLRQSEGKVVDLNAALKWVDEAVTTRSGRALRDPEVVILTGTWRGLTYQQMAKGSEYSTNYLMRDVAPKLWKRLSSVFGRPVGKTNFRVVIDSHEISAEYSGGNDSASLRESAEIGFWELDAARSPTQPSARLPIRTEPTPEEPIPTEPIPTKQARSWHSDSGPVLSPAALTPTPIYGYEAELAMLEQWLAEAADESGESRLIGIWGLRGIGKTLLVQTAVTRWGDRFDKIIWRSLRDRPTLNQLSTSVLTSLGVEVQPALATTQLLHYLGRRSLLLVINDIEAILEPNALAGEYRLGYQSYRDFFETVATVPGTRCCIVLTGIEGPAELVRQGADNRMETVRSRFLTQLSERGAIALLLAELLAEPQTELPKARQAESQTESLTAPHHYSTLISRYQGHPMALKLATRIIKDFFNGQIDSFLAESSTILSDILQLLNPSFDRLSPVEISLFYWLACQEQSLSIAELKQNLPLGLHSIELISALDSLKQRSLISLDRQIDPPRFFLPALIKSFALHKLTRQLSSGVSPPSADSGSTSYNAEPIIDLNPTATNRPTQLSQWFQTQSGPSWHTLDWLFESADIANSMLTARVRGVFPLRDNTFLKRCKPIGFSTLSDRNELVLLVAIRQDTPELYAVGVQIQPKKGDSTLPDQTSLQLLNASQTVLSTVRATARDTFIQLPFFRAELAETFTVEVAIGADSQLEMFVI